MYVAIFTANMDILKKEYQELDKLLIPACKVELTILLGEGIVIVMAALWELKITSKYSIYKSCHIANHIHYMYVCRRIW